MGCVVVGGAMFVFILLVIVSVMYGEFMFDEQQKNYQYCLQYMKIGVTIEKL